MIADFKLLGQLRVLDADVLVVAHHLALAVEKDALASLDVNAGLAVLDLTQPDPRALQVDIDAALFTGDLGSFAHHFDQNLVLLVLDLRCVDTANVHAFAE